MVNIDGFVNPGFESVAEVFEQNFTRRGDDGAAFAVTIDGVPVIDLWGGVSDLDNGMRWNENTIGMIFSGTKGLVAICLLLLLERGELELETPVSRYWPEFAEHGKGEITVAEIASHRARLPGIRVPLTEARITRDRDMATLLARQAQESDERARLAYHPLTYGWLCGELVRRITGTSIGNYFAREVAEPLGLELWIGLPESLEARVASLHYGPEWGMRPQFDDALLASDELLASVWGNPPLFPRDHIPWNTPGFHSCEIPGVNGIGTARSLARLFGFLACGGAVDGTGLLSRATIARGTTEESRFLDPFVAEPMAYGVGLQLQTQLMRYGPPADAFGSAGAGGSIHGAWPSERVGFSYVMNQMRDDVFRDPRSRVLLDALHQALPDGRAKESELANQLRKSMPRP